MTEKEKSAAKPKTPRKSSAKVAAAETAEINLKELKEMYSKRLEEIDPDSKNNQHFLHSTRFKERLLQLDSDLREACAGRGHPTLISHKSAQAEAINKEYEKFLQSILLGILNQDHNH